MYSSRLKWPLGARMSDSNTLLDSLYSICGSVTSHIEAYQKNLRLGKKRRDTTVIKNIYNLCRYAVHSFGEHHMNEWNQGKHDEQVWGEDRAVRENRTAESQAIFLGIYNSPRRHILPVHGAFLWVCLECQPENHIRSLEVRDQAYRGNMMTETKVKIGEIIYISESRYLPEHMSNGSKLVENQQSSAAVSVN